MGSKKYKKRKKNPKNKNKKPCTSSRQKSPVDGTQPHSVICSDPISPPTEKWIFKAINTDSEEQFIRSEEQRNNSEVSTAPQVNIFWNPVQFRRDDGQVKPIYTCHQPKDDTDGISPNNAHVNDEDNSNDTLLNTLNDNNECVMSINQLDNVMNSETKIEENYPDPETEFGIYNLDTNLLLDDEEIMSDTGDYENNKNCYNNVEKNDEKGNDFRKDNLLDTASISSIIDESRNSSSSSCDNKDCNDLILSIADCHYNISDKLGSLTLHYNSSCRNVDPRGNEDQNHEGETSVLDPEIEEKMGDDSYDVSSSVQDPDINQIMEIKQKMDYSSNDVSSHNSGVTINNNKDLPSLIDSTVDCTNQNVTDTISLSSDDEDCALTTNSPINIEYFRDIKFLNNPDRYNNIFPGYNLDLFEKLKNHLIYDYKSTASLSVSDLLRVFKPGVWFNDNVINSYFTLLEERSKGNITLLDTFFFINLTTERYKAFPDQVFSAKSILQKINNLFSQKKIFIPLHLFDHWVLLVVDIQEKIVYYFNSFEDSLIEQAKIVISFLCYKYNMLMNSDMKPEFWKIIKGKSPKQTNSNDCGVFVCSTAEMLTDNRKLIYKEEDCALLRQKIVYELVNKQLVAFSEVY